MAIPKAEFIWLDGKLVKWDDAKLPFLTHTFHYGLGVFEGIRAYKLTPGGTAVFRLRDHMKRLFDSAHIMGMQLPGTIDDLVRGALEIIRANKQESCYLRPVAYYGDEAMGLGAINTVHIGIASFQWGAYLGEDALKSGIRAKIASYQRWGAHTMSAKAKVTGAYIGSILAKREAQAGGYHEAIMMDASGYIAEASGENIFIVRDGTLWTPPLSGAILAGITRDSMLRIADDIGVKTFKESFTRDMLYTADEVFLTGTAAEVTPVREVDNRKIGTGEVGPITKDLQARYFRTVRGEEPRWKEWLTPVYG